MRLQSNKVQLFIKTRHEVETLKIGMENREELGNIQQFFSDTNSSYEDTSVAFYKTQLSTLNIHRPFLLLLWPRQ